MGFYSYNKAMKTEHETPADASALPSLNDLQDRMLCHADRLEKLFGKYVEQGDTYGRDYHAMALKAHSQFRLSLEHLQRIETLKKIQAAQEQQWKVAEATTKLMKAYE
ncbi:MAG: hypothetical protein JWR51_4752 [Devosia sp.]|nr:hypothetical protein [Devosia sp.]